MAWKASGDERVKSYRAYQELEERLRVAERKLEEAALALAAKDNAMQHVISAFSHAMTRLPSGHTSDHPPARKESGVQAQVTEAAIELARRRSNGE